MENKNYLLIDRNIVVKAIREKHQAANLILVLEYLCTKCNIETALPADEVCQILSITPETLENSRRHRLIKGFMLGQIFFYSAYEISLLPERLNRAKILKLIGSIPIVPAP